MPDAAAATPGLVTSPTTTSHTDEPLRVAGVCVRPLECLAEILKCRLVDVLTANMYFEEETGLRNQAGQDNLTEALSHIGTLFTDAHAMDETEQAHEVHELEDHLRRSMMESYETTFIKHMGQVELKWAEHAALARPLQASGELLGAPDIEKIERLRRRCKALYRDGRMCKRGKGWDTWIKGTNLLIKACDTAVELLDELKAGVAVAEQHRRDKEERAERNRRAEEEKREQAQLTKRETNRSIRAGLIVAAITLPLGIAGGWGLAELTADDPKPADVQPVPKKQERSDPNSSGGG